MSHQEAMTAITAREYVEALRRQGKKAFLEKDGVLWQESERFAMERQPDFCLDVPQPREVRSLLRRCRCLVATCIVPADSAHPANAWLYVCEDRGYTLEGLGSPARRNARRACREFRFDFIDPAALLLHGTRPFCDTRTRVGLSDGTPQLFQKYAAALIANPGYKFVGAWRGDQLAAFLWMLLVNDWATIGAYAANEHLRYCPNNGLLHFALDYCLTQGRCRVVSYGLSSIQAGENVATLDFFKKKVGFEARPVHRDFLFHPLLRPLVNPLSYWLLQRFVRIWPRNRLLRKGLGLAAIQLGYHKPLPSSSSGEGDAAPTDSSSE